MSENRKSFDGLSLPVLRVTSVGNDYSFEIYGTSALSQSEKQQIVRFLSGYEKFLVDNAGNHAAVPCRKVCLDQSAEYPELTRFYELVSRVAEEPDTISYKLVNYGWTAGNPCLEPETTEQDDATQPQAIGLDQ